MPRIKCKHCKRLLGYRLGWISGGIGPSVYKCRSCHDVMPSQKSEWLWQGRAEKNRYKFHSAVLAVVCGVAVAAALSFLVRHWTGRLPSPSEMAVLFAAAAAATLLVQSLRVMISVMRDSRGDIRPVTVGFFSFETNPLVPFALPPLVAAAAYWLVGPLI